MAKDDLTAAPQLEAPRFAMGWAALVYAMATLTLAYPALTGAFLVNPRSDQYIAGYAFREFAAASLRAGQGFPQWNPYQFGGMPYIAAMHGDIFYPTFLLRMVMPTDHAMTWGFIIHLFLAGLFTFCFLRAWGVGFYGALVGGLAYMLSGPVAGYASPGHDGKLFVSALLPLALWMLVRGVRDGRLWSWGVLAFTVGLAVLSPHPQLLQYLLLASGSFALLLAFRTDERGAKLPRSLALRRLGFALGAIVIGMLMGGVQYLPLVEYTPWSPRAGGAGWEHAISYSMPIEELWNAVVPQFSGILDHYWGRNGIHLHSEYAGVTVLVLAGAGMFAPAQSRSARWFWIGTGIVSLLWALGGNTPFYSIIYAIPIFGAKYFRAPSTMMFVTMFSLAVLAGMGAERVLKAASTIPNRYLLLWAAAIGGIALILAAGLPGAVASSVAAGIEASGRPNAAGQAAYVRELASSNQRDVVVGALRSIVFVMLALGAIWTARAARLDQRKIAWILVALVAADLWSITHKYWMFSARASAIYATDPAIEYMKAAKIPGRVVAADILQQAKFRDPIYGGAALMSHGVRQVAGYQGNELGRYRQLMERGSKFFLGDRQEFWRHENVHYLYTTVPDSLLPLLTSQLGYVGQFTKVLGPVTNASGSSVYLYRVPGENPPAVVASAIVKGSDDQALATVLDPRFDPARAVIVDTAAPVQAANLTAAPQPSGVQATVTRYDPAAIDVQLDKPVPAGTALVVSENYFPGWTASADGKEATVVRANYNLIGVVLPAGAREVRLSFVDRAYERGKAVTLLAIAMAALALIAGILLDRRRPALAA